MIQCPHCQSQDVVKKGFFPVRGPTSHYRVQRYLCRGCGKRFSTQTTAATYRQKKSFINQKLFRILCHGISQRSCAVILGINRETVARRITAFGMQARAHLAASFVLQPAGDEVIFDEMESFEHSKCKPLSMALAVEKNTRRILDVQVAVMPAKGLLAAISRKKYGRRRDDRRQALSAMCATILEVCPQVIRLISDQSPRYPDIVRRFFPGAEHVRHKGRRGCVVGQGELKRGGYDPLFDLNHTCAMFRDRLKRLSRRTWCTTKRPNCLQDLMSMYAWYHNEALAGRGRAVHI